MFQAKVVEKIKTRILYSVSFFNKCVICELMWKNAVEPDRSQIPVWNMHIACWKPKAANVYSEYVIFIAFPPQQWLHEHASVLR
jgi:hypothetical protein